MRRVAVPGGMDELDDARAVRLERQEKAAHFHPLDPARERGISESPWTLADAGDPPRDTRAAMSDPTHPDHPDHRLYLGSRHAVHRPDASLGRAPDEHSANMTASIARLAPDNGLDALPQLALSGQGERQRPR